MSKNQIMEMIFVCLMFLVIVLSMVTGAIALFTNMTEGMVWIGIGAAEFVSLISWAISDSGRKR